MSENITDLTEDEGVEPEEGQKSHNIVVRVLLWMFIVLNALVVLFALLPAIISMPFLRHISVPTPWFIYTGYGTPLGLTLMPAILVSIICLFLIAHTVYFLRRVAKKAQLCLCIISAIVCVLCAIMLIGRFSEDPQRYIRGAIASNLPYGVELIVEVNCCGCGNYVYVEIYTSDIYVSKNEFESFVIDMQELILQALQRRRIDRFIFAVQLRPADDVCSGLVWYSRSHIWWLGEKYNFPAGEYGALELGSEFPYVRIIGRNQLGSIATRSFLPVTRIQESIEALVAVNEFAKDLGGHMENVGSVSPHIIHVERDEVFTNLLGIDANKIGDNEGHRPPAVTKIIVGEVDVFISHGDDIHLDDLEASIIDSDSQVRAIAQRHGLEVRPFATRLRVYELPNVNVWWRSEGCGEYGRLQFSWQGSVFEEFEEVYIGGIHELLTDELINVIRRNA